MLAYIVIFTGIGLFLGIFLKSEIAYIWLMILTIAWAFLMGPWAVATFIELALGIAIGQGIQQKVKVDKKEKLLA